MSYDVGELVASIQMDVDDMQRQLDSAVKIFGRMGAGMDKLNTTTLRTEKLFQDMGDSIKMSSVRMMQGFNNVEVAIDKLPHSFRDLTTASQQTARVLSSVVAPQLQTLINQMSRLNAASLQAGQGMRQGLGGLGSAFSSAGSSGYAFTDGLSGKLREVTTNIFFVQMAVEQLGSIFKTVFGQGIGFAANMEVTLIGLASVITSVMQQKGGGELPFTDGLKLAEEVLADMKQEALKTTATLEELMKVFQGILAPAAALGMTMKQIKDFTVFGSTAVKSMGLKDDQLVQELRSLLTGNITARSSTVATSLGITNEQITEAKGKIGGVFKFLEDKFKSFKASTDYMGSTLIGIWTNIQDGIQQTQEKAFTSLFAGLKRELFNLQSMFIVVKKQMVDVKDEFGNITGEKKEIAVASLNEDTVARFRAIADVTEKVYRDLKHWVIELSNNEVFLNKINNVWLSINNTVTSMYKNIDSISVALLTVWGMSGGWERLILSIMGLVGGIDGFFKTIETYWPVLLAGYGLLSIATSKWATSVALVLTRTKELGAVFPVLTLVLEALVGKAALAGGAMTTLTALGPWTLLAAAIGTVVYAVYSLWQNLDDAVRKQNELNLARKQGLAPGNTPFSFTNKLPTQTVPESPSLDTESTRLEDKLMKAKEAEENKKEIEPKPVVDTSKQKQAYKDSLAALDAKLAAEIRKVKEAQAIIQAEYERGNMSELKVKAVTIGSNIALAISEIQILREKVAMEKTAAEQSRTLMDLDKKQSELRLQLIKNTTEIYKIAENAYVAYLDTQIQGYEDKGEIETAAIYKTEAFLQKNKKVFIDAKNTNEALLTLISNLKSIEDALATGTGDPELVKTLKLAHEESLKQITVTKALQENYTAIANETTRTAKLIPVMATLQQADLKLAIATLPIEYERAYLAKQERDLSISIIDAKQRKYDLDNKQADALERQLATYREQRAMLVALYSDSKNPEHVTKIFNIDRQIVQAESNIMSLRHSASAASDEIQSTLTSNLSDAFASIIDGTKSVSDAFRDMAKAVLASIAKIVANKFATEIVNMFFGRSSRLPASSGVSAPLESAPFATGGFVYGPGTATSDSIPALLSNGEFVLRASAVSRLGRQALEYINAYGTLPKLRFASGGYVGTPSSPRAGGAPNISLNIVNQSGTQISASQDDMYIDAAGYVMNVVVNSVANNKNGTRDMLTAMLKK